MRHIVKKLFLLFCLIVFGHNIGSSQILKPDYLGIGYSYGTNNFFGAKAWDYSYKLHLFEALISYRLNPQRKHKLLLNVQPQFNTTKLVDESNTETKGIEFGINLAVSFQYRVNNWIEPYILLGVGPHYISKTLERQSKGFIFSDNFEVGFKIHVNNEFTLSPNLGFRHISNASLKSPNFGINNFIYGIALIKKLEYSDDE